MCKHDLLLHTPEAAGPEAAGSADVAGRAPALAAAGSLAQLPQRPQPAAAAAAAARPDLAAAPAPSLGSGAFYPRLGATGATSSGGFLVAASPPAPAHAAIDIGRAPA